MRKTSRPAIRQVVLILLSLCASLDCHAQRVGEDWIKLKWTLEPKKKAFLPGEPAIVRLQVSNPTESRVFIHMGPEFGFDVFDMEIIDLADMTVSPSRRPIARGGGWATHSERIDLPPGESCEKRLIVNRWCSTRIAPGTYAVKCRFKPHALGPEFSFRCPLTILPADKNALDAIINELRRTVLFAADASGVTKEFIEWEFQKRLLGCTESDSAVPHQIRLLEVVGSSRLQEDVLDVLARSESGKAAQGIVRVFPSLGGVRPNALSAIRELRASGKPEILRATEQFAKTHRSDIGQSEKKEQPPRRKPTGLSGPNVPTYRFHPRDNCP